MSHTSVGMKKKTGAVKIAISLPREEADYVEAVRKRLRITRSAVIRDAIAQRLKSERRAELDRQCEEAYRRMPETEEERTWHEAALKAWAEDMTEQERKEWR